MEKAVVRVGFIGCGRHATKMLYPSLKLARLELAAVCDVDEAKARRNARWFGAERVYTDHRRMLDSEKLDAVLICTGPTTHVSLALDCLERRLPVFIEKPPALTLAQAQRLHARSKELGVPVMVGTMKRHALVYRRLKEIMDSPDFGPVSAVQAKMTTGWKNGNGFALLLDAGIHMIDLLRYLMGEIKDVSHRKCEHEATYVSYAIALSFASGAVGTLFISDEYLWTRSGERVEVTGRGQFAIAENLVHLSHYRPDGQISVWEPGFSIPNDENLTYFIVGYAGELQSFAEAVHTGGPVNASIADACADLAIVKMLEPDEAYVKGPQDYPHWQSENYWLQTDPTGGGTS
jgi:myo-inositol 2-dehydrogenase/D-chiro-inositol 1-dehydrogenase